MAGRTAADLLAVLDVGAVRLVRVAAQNRVERIAALVRPLPEDLELSVRRSDEIPEASRAEIVDWLATTFAWREQYADFDWHLEAVAGTERLAHLGLVHRTVRIGERRLDVALVGGVLTEPRWRKRGLATALMRRADSFVEHALGLRFGLLLCGEQLVPMYQHLGWSRVESPLVYAQPQGPRLRHGPAMVRSYDGGTWPAGVVDLQGLPA